MERIGEYVLVHPGQEAGMEPGLEGVLKNEPLVAATPNSELLWVFERDDFRDRSKEVLLAILLESQSWRSLRGCPTPKREEGKKREPLPSAQDQLWGCSILMPLTLLTKEKLVPRFLRLFSWKHF